MSTSPLPPDPYEALGIDKDADSDAVKKAHRKLVLKHHPDRIKDPALVEENKNAFQKVQQAYEILVDPVRRERYDNEVKLAQLRKERLMSETTRAFEPALRPTYTRTTYAARPSPAATQAMPRETPIREYKPDPRYEYEERTPDSYFDIPAAGSRYEEPLPRGHARKAESNERRSSAAKPAEKKESPKISAWAKSRPSGLPFGAAFNLKEKAASAKKKIEDREAQARAAKARDKDEKSARSAKQARSAYMESGSDSSDSDTVVATPRRKTTRDRSPMRRSLTPEPQARRRPASPQPPPDSRRRGLSPEPPRRRRPSPQTETRRSRQASPQSDSRRRQPSPQPYRGPVFAEEEYESPDEKYRGHHYEAKEYIAASQKSKRPPVSRQNSDLYEQPYWVKGVKEQVREQGKEHKRSGSDSDRQRAQNSPQPSRNHRRSAPPEDPEKGRPHLPTQASAPAGVRQAAQTFDREPTSRSRQNSYDTPRNHRRDMAEKVSHPPLHRGVSDPVRTGSKRDTAPMKGSGLKQEHRHDQSQSQSQNQNHHDSGYGSGSSPQTPETGYDSSAEQRAEARTKTTYRATKQEDVHRVRKTAAEEIRRPLADDGGDLRRFLSPEDATQHYKATAEPVREARASRTRQPEPRSSSSRPSLERRSSINRAESSSRYEEQRPRKHRAERSPEPSHHRRPVDMSQLKYASYRNAPPTKYAMYDEHAPVAHRSRRPSFQIY